LAPERAVKGLLLAGAFAGGIAVAAAGWALWPQVPRERSATELMEALMWGREPVGGPFALIDHNGQPRTDADFRGKLLLIYFGFTFCSDVCPIELQAMGSAIDQLGPAGDGIQPLFITVDPEKDTPDQLKSYVTLFHPRLIGLTGDPHAIKKVALAYKVYYAKSDPTRNAGTEVDHTSFIFLVDPEGKYLGFAPPGTSPGRLAEIISHALARKAIE
jgi:cytochrome oxidase Cu insertion factor (SCO1/SenC/PrrC family)